MVQTPSVGLESALVNERSIQLHFSLKKLNKSLFVHMLRIWRRIINAGSPAPGGGTDLSVMPAFSFEYLTPCLRLIQMDPHTRDVVERAHSRRDAWSLQNALWQE